ncbi:MAG TPA: efflux RND transporter periplasmic adaptor subunit [Candidatus Krumholzibacteria bacterium]|nr:efflux RND transporter periplasmic adaptor subunit [Candidatus Krumholzibacteria bacterium]
MKRTLIICVAIVAAGAGAIAILFATEPEAKREGATKQTAMLVDLLEVRRGTYRPTVVVTGVVEPARDVVAAPRIEGQIVEVAPSFEPGGFIDAGELLVRIDPSDYRNQVRQRRSDLAQAQADLDVEMGRQNVARQDYELLDTELEPGNEALVLREPQLETARARVEAARAALEQAELELERTTVLAPFDAHVLERTADLGSHVRPGDTLARLVGVDTYWVVVAVPVPKLDWLRFPEDGEAGARVRVRNRTAWPEGAFREGRLHRLIGSLEGRTRLARVLVTVDDPLVREDGDADRRPLILGSFVEARIEGRPVEGAVRLPREYLRADDTVWVMQDGALDVRDVRIEVRDQQYVYVSEGLEDGDRVVTTNLTTVVDGAPLRTAEESS